MGSGKNKIKNKGRPATVSIQKPVDSVPVNPTPAANLVKPVNVSPVDSLSGSRTLGDVDSWSVLTPKEFVAETSSVAKVSLDQQNRKKPGTAPKRQVFERMKLQKVEFEEFAYKAAPEHMESVPSSLEFTLVGYVTGKFPGRKAIINECQTWGVNFQIHFHDSGWIIVKLHSEGDRDQVCLRGPYSVNGRWFVLKPLPRYFRFQNREDKVVPVWIRLPNLPLEMWTFDSLSNIVSRIGVPLNSDAATLKRDKLSFARVLVEVDLSKDLIYSVPVEIPDGDDFEQQIIYESVPNFCSSCKRVGHLPTHCPLLKSSQSGSKASGMQNDAAKAVHIRFVEDSEGYVNPCVSPSCAAQSHRDATRSNSDAILESLGTKAALGDRGKYPSPAVDHVLEGGSSKSASALEKGMSDSISGDSDSRRSSRSPLRGVLPEQKKSDLEPKLAGPEQGTGLMSQVRASSSDERTSSSEEGSSSGSESEGELAQRVAESVIFSEENNLEEPGNFRNGYRIRDCRVAGGRGRGRGRGQNQGQGQGRGRGKDRFKRPDPPYLN